MKAANNGLPTRANKKYRHIEDQDVCQLCGQQAEDTYHALVVCPHALALRQAMRDHWTLPAEQELFQAEPEWLLMLVYNNSVEALANLFMLFWHTWNIRNKVIHDGTPPFVASSVTFLTRYMDSLLMIRKQGVQHDIKGKRSMLCGIQKQKGVKERKRWRLPLQGTFKINVDAAFNPISGEAAVGVVIRDWEGGLKLTAWRTISYCRDAEEAEARACLEGANMALRWPDIPMTLESDCQTVVSKLHAAGRDRSILWQFIDETRAVGSQLCKLEFFYISREQNNLAYELAQFAISFKDCQCFFACFPEWIVSLSCKDII
jgi:ribonuclease HI